MRALLVPRWGGGPDDDWYGWLADELDPDPSVEALDVVELAPRANAPEPEACVAGLAEATGAAIADRLVLIGHSVGCQALLRFLAAAAPEGPELDLVCIAGWWGVDQPWEEIEPWLRDDYDVERARAAVGSTTVLLSDNDPFTANHRATANLWRERMGAEIALCPRAGHFNAGAEPAVLDIVRTALER